MMALETFFQSSETWYLDVAFFTKRKVQLVKQIYVYGCHELLSVGYFPTCGQIFNKTRCSIVFYGIQSVL